jgi:hypothetical protein
MNYNNKYWIEIDAFLKGTSPFWYSLVEHCCMDCCGMDAFDLSEKKIIAASNYINTNFLVEKLQLLVHYLKQHKENYYISFEILNHSGSKNEIIDLLQHIINVICGVSTTTLTENAGVSV